LTLPKNFYDDLYENAPKRLSYDGQSGDAFFEWSTQLREKLTELLKFPADRAAPEVDVLSSETCDGFTREKVIIRNGWIDEIPAYALIPDAAKKRPAPGIICLHGHGGYFAGKDMVAGITDDSTHPIAVECAEALNYPYGVQLARAGFITICPDAYNFGERVHGRYHARQHAGH
jgi:hypothetical protein